MEPTDSGQTQRELPYLSNEVWQLIATYCDLGSLISLSRTSSRFLDTSSREILSRCKASSETRERVDEAITTLGASHISPRYRRLLFNKLEYKVDSWKRLRCYPEPIIRELIRDRLVDACKVGHNLFLELFKPEDWGITTADIRRLPPNLLYKIWEPVFLASPEKEAIGAAKQNKKNKESLYLRKKLLTLLTDEVMTTFRKRIVINDRFVLKCFEHGLDSILLYLLENRQFFQFNITAPQLEDLYLMIACDTSGSAMFLRLVQSVGLPHIRYALRHATFDFLMILWKSRKHIENFDVYIDTIRSDPDQRYLSDFKQRQFIDWCIIHP